jgi:uncharacterized protein YbjQ (UPF0145 family)
MKKLVLIILVLTLASCATYSPLVSFVDYSSYNNDGIFLTESNSVSFKYEPVGSINVLLYSGFANDVKKAPVIEDKKGKGDDIYYSANNGRLKYKDATIQEALRLAVENARNKGANAIINIRYEYIPAFKNNPDGWHMSGMAIKR